MWQKCLEVREEMPIFATYLNVNLHGHQEYSPRKGHENRRYSQRTWNYKGWPIKSSQRQSHHRDAAKGGWSVEGTSDRLLPRRNRRRTRQSHRAPAEVSLLRTRSEHQGRVGNRYFQVFLGTKKREPTWLPLLIREISVIRVRINFYFTFLNHVVCSSGVSMSNVSKPFLMTYRKFVYELLYLSLSTLFSAVH